MPIDYKKYPKNWKTEIVPRIKKRANHKCEKCGVGNYCVGYRLLNGQFVELIQFDDYKSARQEVLLIRELGLHSNYKCIVIVLTSAHLDHDETNHNVKDDRLMAMCQRCHLKYDAKEKSSRKKLKSCK